MYVCREIEVSRLSLGTGYNDNTNNDNNNNNNKFKFNNMDRVKDQVNGFALVIIYQV